VKETGVDWDIVWDDRGHFTEPHTKYAFGLGTISVRNYLAAIGAPSFLDPDFSGGIIQTHGPDGCFGAVLFVEKEGFMPLFERVRLAERHDIALMSTKGMSVTAARKLIDVMCSRDNIPVFVLHDFDVAGFSIFATLAGDTGRYQFRNNIKVIDLGLRLADVVEFGLESESVSLGNTDPGKIRQRLRRNGATDPEIEFLLNERRVELNAMASGQLVEFVRRKLAEHGVAKIIPGKQWLDGAYRLAVRSERLRKVVGAAFKAFTEDNIIVPDDLAPRVKERLNNSDLSWASIVAEIAAAMETENGGLG
jgi:hypothetical protein